MECAQINIVGGSGSASPATYSIPGIYKATDPGLLINIYSMTTSSKYTIPGPAVFSCSGGSTGGGGSNPATTLVTSTTTAPATSTKASSAPAATSSAPSSGGGSTGCTTAQWQQCGGTGFSGCTTCASGFKCNVVNAYYSQCY